MTGLTQTGVAAGTAKAVQCKGERIDMGNRGSIPRRGRKFNLSQTPDWF